MDRKRKLCDKGKGEGLTWCRKRLGGTTGKHATKQGIAPREILPNNSNISNITENTRHLKKNWFKSKPFSLFLLFFKSNDE